MIDFHQKGAPAMKKKLSDDLPDYTVADMNVDGMPWNTRRPWQLLPGDPSAAKK